MTTAPLLRPALLAGLLALSACVASDEAAIDDVTTTQSTDALAITAAGVSGLPASTRFSEAAIEQAMPGFDASSITMATENQTRTALAVFKDGLQMLQVLPGAGGAIGAVHGVSARLRGPNGERIGMTLSEARLSRSDCRDGMDNWLGMPICTARGAPTVTLVFSIPGFISPEGLPDDATLATATLQRIIWTAPTTPGAAS